MYLKFLMKKKAGLTDVHVGLNERYGEKSCNEQMSVIQITR
jgi:hypothetical protein